MAVLVREPFNRMDPELFATLTDGQIAAIYFHERDDDGHLIFPDDSGQREAMPMSYPSLFACVWRERGKTDAEIKQLWQAHLESERGRQTSHRKT